MCENCGELFRDGLSNILCGACFDSISPYEDPVCGHCGVSLPIRGFEHALQLRCRDCGEESYFLDKVRAFGAYEGALRIAHHGFKFEGMENFKKKIASKLWDTVPDIFWNEVEALVPVPLSPEKQRERGYNPAFLLAQELSLKNHIPVQLLLRKVRPTRPQMSLSRAERIHNPEGAYQKAFQKPLNKIVLVDDVFTTGATLEECAKVLKKAGVWWVGAVVFGRTPRYEVLIKK